LRLRGGRELRAELLSVDSASVLLMLDSEVLVARFDDMERLRVDPGIEAVKYDGGILSAPLLQRIRERSRFPYGITPKALAALLEAGGRQAPTPVRP